MGRASRARRWRRPSARRPAWGGASLRVARARPPRGRPPLRSLRPSTTSLATTPATEMWSAPCSWPSRGAPSAPTRASGPRCWAWRGGTASGMAATWPSCTPASCWRPWRQASRLCVVPLVVPASWRLCPPGSFAPRTAGAWCPQWACSQPSHRRWSRWGMVGSFGLRRLLGCWRCCSSKRTPPSCRRACPRPTGPSGTRAASRGSRRSSWTPWSRRWTGACCGTAGASLSSASTSPASGR
mmetsp:Transcript_40104/g.115714  ORF Transcript_40104/g.115714 Transcript_40104/m.115714 type:complete len:241 (+) Transcript_40104:139-861(+)